MAGRNRVKPLSDKQRAILAFMNSYIEQNSFPPTIRDICDATNIKSTSVVNYNLNKLVVAEMLERSSRKSRGLRLTDKARVLLGYEAKPSANAKPRIMPARVPMIGFIGASEPIPMPEEMGAHYDESDLIDVMPMLLRNADPAEVYALRVKGNSMIDAMVRDGDIVVFRRQETARDGEMVAVRLTDRGETTLKYFYNEGERIRLQPAHPTMQPIYVNPAQCQIQGRVLSIIRPAV
jgi:repressor LexA